MMSIAETTERALLEAVAARYKADGFDVFVEPSQALLPPFMQEYRPDAVAIGPGKKVAIEIARAGERSADKLKRLHERFSGHDDWEFVVLYVTPGAGTERMEVAPVDAIKRAIQSVTDLRSAGQPMAALVLGWSALDGTARALLPDRLARPQPPASLIEVLAGEGYITPSEADSLRIAAGVRNEAAHGQLDVAVEAKHLDGLLAALRTLASFLPKNAA
jgi:hypothetical protein